MNRAQNDCSREKEACAKNERTLQGRKESSMECISGNCIQQIVGGGWSRKGRHHAKDRIVCRNEALVSGCELGVGMVQAFIFLWK